MDRLLGQVFNGKYRLVRSIGRGGMGVVYEAEHLGLGTRVALKTLLPRVADDKQAYDRFCQEARAASRLQHPHIASVIDFDHADDVAYMVMEYLEGRDLSRLLQQERRLPAERLVPMIRKVCSGVHAAHQHNIVHRDLKPQNIFICNYEELSDFPKILDFGISKILDATGGLTETDATLGTPYYMSPEQAEGRSREVDARTDVYALGAIVYRALAGRHAFSGTTPLSVMYQVAHGGPDTLTEVAPDIDPAFGVVVHRAMARAPEQRYSTATLFAEALQGALDGAPPDVGAGRLTGKTQQGWSSKPPMLDSGDVETLVDTGIATRGRESTKPEEGQRRLPGQNTDRDLALAPEVTASQELTEEVHFLRRKAAKKKAASPPVRRPSPPIARPNSRRPPVAANDPNGQTAGSDTAVVRSVSGSRWPVLGGGVLLLALLGGGIGWLLQDRPATADAALNGATAGPRDSGPALLWVRVNGTLTGLTCRVALADGVLKDAPCQGRYPAGEAIHFEVLNGKTTLFSDTWTLTDTRDIRVTPPAPPADQGSAAPVPSKRDRVRLRPRIPPTKKAQPAADNDQEKEVTW